MRDDDARPILPAKPTGDGILSSRTIDTLIRWRFEWVKRQYRTESGRRLSRCECHRQAIADVENTLIAIKRTAAARQLLGWVQEVMSGRLKQKRRDRVKRVRRLKVQTKAQVNIRNFLAELEAVA